MSSPLALAFDDRTARTLERMYSTPDVVAQRARLLQRLALAPGERVLDVGVGPGLLLHDMARSLGEGGRAAGVDQSEDMVAMTRARCADLDCDVRVADATALPFDDGAFDAVTSTQVYEYVPDMATALLEVHRVLRPGGRVAILDTDWDSVVWNTGDRARMRRVLDAWDEHLHDPHLPATLAVKLGAAGFQVTGVDVIPLVNPHLHPHCYSHGILRIIERFVAGRGGVSEEEARDWGAELRALGESGAYFFSLNRYLFTARRP
jgi:arsenite methyltransferase